ncbi:hypothetical protein ACHAXT_007300 [Thalassiosira profunda]
MEAARTYVAGEDTGRLSRVARDFGIQQRTARPVRDSISHLFRSEISLRMHSAGVIGQDERIDNSGTLHYVSVRRRAKQDYGSVHELFQKEGAAPAEITEEEEEEEIVEPEGGSLGAATFGIIKGTVGPAILYLPHGFQASGWAVAVPAMIFATICYIFNAYRLLDCWKLESERNHQMAARISQVRTLLAAEEDETFTPKLLTYPELARRAFGPWSFLVEFGITSFQFGVCLTYLIFVPQNLQQCWFALTGHVAPKVVFLIIMLAIEVPLSWISDIRKLTPTNVAATLLIAYGLASVMCLAFAVGSAPSDTDATIFRENLRDLPAFTDAWFIFIGTAFFMMEGSITLLVPLQEAVFKEEDKAKFPALNRIVTSWIVVFYILFSFVCVTAFGHGIRTAMTASLTGKLATTVQLAYSIAVIFTFPLQAFPAMQVTVKALLGDKRTRKPQPNDAIKRNVVATCIVLLLGVIAVVAIDYLGNVVSILGSLFGIPLALVFPPLMHNSLIKDSPTSTRLLNFFVVLIGFFGVGAASYATIASWDKGAEGG